MRGFFFSLCFDYFNASSRKRFCFFRQAGKQGACPLEVFFGIIQAYVFFLLSTIFISGATVSHHGDDRGRVPASSVVAYLPHMAHTLTRRRAPGCPANRERARRPLPTAVGLGRM